MTKNKPKCNLPSTLYNFVFNFRLINQCQKTNSKSNTQTPKKKQTTNLYNNKCLSLFFLKPHLPEVRLAVITRQSKTAILPHPGSIVPIIQE